MQLNRFYFFSNAVLAEKIFNDAKPPEVFRFYQEKWYGLDGSEINVPALTDDLELAHSGDNHYWRGKSQRACYIRVAQFCAYVKLYFSSPPRDSTQRYFSEQVRLCYQNSNNAFDATHDSLTELLNRKGFEPILDAAIKTTAAQVKSTAVLAKSGLSLLSFDIDFFKQLNDSFCHQYGDIVLIAFAWRLQEVVAYVASLHGVKASVARMGGEEFVVLLDGISDHASSLQLAEEIQRGLSKDPLPSRDQVPIIQKEADFFAISIPPETDRKVTASVGHTTFAKSLPNIDNHEIRKVAATLVREADRALYRAKADGRDCVRSFKDIRNKLGRVLEHHAETNFVAIDIGSDVGVQLGNEFLVYHPKFVGDFPFTYSDGRTVRKLGNYPRVPSGRLAVRYVEKDIAFCEIIENALTTGFPIGSRIEYVPLGSITHRFTKRDDLAELPILSQDEIKLALDNFIEAGKPFAAVAFGIPSLPEITAQSGIAHANRLLASVLLSLQRHSVPKTLITTINIGTSIDFLLLIPDVDINAADKFITVVVDDHSKEVECHAAACLSTKLSNLGIDLHGCFDLARLAQQVASPIGFFDEGTAPAVMNAWRAQARYDEAIADYRRFVSYGVRAALMENCAGLCFLERDPPDYGSAIECFSAAAIIKPDDITFSLNLAYAYTWKEDYLNAVEIFIKHHEALISGVEIYVSYLAAYAHSFELCFKRNMGDLAPARLKSLLEYILGLPDVCSWFRDERLDGFRKLILEL